jgi:hypothetical protein
MTCKKCKKALEQCKCKDLPERLEVLRQTEVVLRKSFPKGQVKRLDERMKSAFEWAQIEVNPADDIIKNFEKVKQGIVAAPAKAIKKKAKR